MVRPRNLTGKHLQKREVDTMPRRVAKNTRAAAKNTSNDEITMDEDKENVDGKHPALPILFQSATIKFSNLIMYLFVTVFSTPPPQQHATPPLMPALGSAPEPTLKDCLENRK